MRKVPNSVWIMGVLLVAVVLVMAVVLSNNNRSLTDINFPIVITEFFDYRCSHCAQFADVMVATKAQYGDQVQLDYKHYPFLSDASYELAYAAEAAREQGKFEEFHIEAFATFKKLLNGEITDDLYTPETIAATIGLDLEKFNTDRASQVILDRVNAQKTEGKNLGVTGTPSVFISGKLQDIAEVDSAGKVVYTKFTNTIQRLVDIATQNAQAATN